LVPSFYPFCPLRANNFPARATASLEAGMAAWVPLALGLSLFVLFAGKQDIIFLLTPADLAE
jgi:hypothetical protein